MLNQLAPALNTKPYMCFVLLQQHFIPLQTSITASLIASLLKTVPHSPEVPSRNTPDPFFHSLTASLTLKHSLEPSFAATSRHGCTFIKALVLLSRPILCQALLLNFNHYVLQEVLWKSAKVQKNTQKHGTAFKDGDLYIYSWCKKILNSNWSLPFLCTLSRSSNCTWSTQLYLQTLTSISCEISQGPLSWTVISQPSFHKLHRCYAHCFQCACDLGTHIDGDKKKGDISKRKWLKICTFWSKHACKEAGFFRLHSFYS